MEGIPTDIGSICDELINFEPHNSKKRKLNTESVVGDAFDTYKFVRSENDSDDLVEVPNARLVEPDSDSFHHKDISIKNAKHSGLAIVNSVTEATNACLVFLSIGTGVWTNSDNVKREFINHIGAFSPTDDKEESKFFKAVVSPGLFKQLREDLGNVTLQRDLQTLGYSAANKDIFYHDQHKCVYPIIAVRSLLTYLTDLKQKKNSKLYIIMQSRKQVEIFKSLNAAVPVFKGVLNQTIDGMFNLDIFTKLTKHFANHTHENLATLQAAPENEEKLLMLLYSKSDLMSLALFETFCIIVYIEATVREKLMEVLGYSHAEIIVGTDMMEESAKQRFPNESSISSNNEIITFTESEDYLPAIVNSYGYENLDGDIQENPSDNLEDNSLLLLENSDGTESNKENTNFEITDQFLMEEASYLTTNPTIHEIEDIRDHFHTDSTITIFIDPIFYSKAKTISTSRLSFYCSTEAAAAENSLLLLNCFIHPNSESFKVAVKPLWSLLKTEAFQKLHQYQADGQNLNYLAGDGSSLTCESKTGAFDLLSRFLGKVRKEHPHKQFNIFVKDFEIFKNLMAYKEFASLLRSCENIVTLFSKSTSSLARVPNIPLSSLASYLNTILSRDNSCVLHKEHVSNLFSGGKF